MARANKIKGGQSWENKYAYDSLATNADEAEWQAVLDGEAHLSAGTFDEAIADAGDEFAPDAADQLLNDDPLQGMELLQEARQGTVLEQLIERSETLGDAYPFEISGNTLVYRANGAPIYELLLGICQAPSLTKAPYCDLPRLFERISLLAGKGFLGPLADGFRMGWPRPETMSRFRDAVLALKTQSGSHPSEWQWCPDEHLPENPAPALVKEEGLDVVVWRRWPDNRIGQLYLLGQCACGKDWLKKDKDLDLTALNSWVKLPRTAPVKSFFTPRYAVAPILLDLARDAGLVFDRIRIVQALQQTHLAAELATIEPEIAACIRIAKEPLAA